MSRVRPIVLEILTEAREEGRTWREISEVLRFRYLSDGSHGSVSGALSSLDAAGHVVRLTERRDRCSVYVLPEFINQRPVATPKRSNGGWLAGYDAGYTEAEEKAHATAPPPNPDLVEIHAEGVAEGRRRARADMVGFIDVLILEGSKGQPAQPHDKTCWRKHPMCALLAVKKNLTIGE